jgi:lichenan operon transcriptional antiterminator
MKNISVLQTKILKKLLTDNIVSGTMLMTSFGISAKTLRREIYSLDQIIKESGIEIKSKTGSGYYLSYVNKDSFQSFKESFFNGVKHNRIGKTDKDYRVEYIARKFLVNTDYLLMDDLAEELYSSRSTISQDIKKVKALLINFDIQVLVRPNHGMYIKCSDFNRFTAIIYLHKKFSDLNQELKSKESNYHSLFKIGEKNREIIKDSILEAINHIDNYSLPQVYLRKVFFFTIISYSFNKKESNFIIGNDAIKEASTFETYNLAENYVEIINKALCINLNEDYIAMFAIIFLVYQSSNLSSYYENKEIKEIKKISINLCEYLNEQFNTNCFYNHDLITELTKELYFIKIRKKYCLPLDNEAYFKVKLDGIIVPEICSAAAYFFNKEYEIKLDQDDVYSLYFVFSKVEREIYLSQKRNILLISLYGNNYANNIKERLIELYPENINKIEIKELHQLKVIEQQKYDVIFTDGLKDDMFNSYIQIKEINLIRKEEDINSIEKYFKGYEDILENINEYCPEKGYNSELNLHDKDEVLKYVSQLMIEEFNFNNKYYEDIKEKNEILSFERVNRIAFIKSYKSYSDKTFISFIALKNKILWDKEEVQFIIVFNQGYNDTEKTKNLFNLMKMFFYQENMGLDNIIGESYEVFIGYLSKLVDGN